MYCLEINPMVYKYDIMNKAELDPLSDAIMAVCI